LADLVDEGCPNLFLQFPLRGTDIFDISLKEDYGIGQGMGDIKEPSFPGIGTPLKRRGGVPCA